MSIHYNCQLMFGLMVGFLGHITNSMIGITARIKDDKLEVKVYFDKEPDFLEKEIAYMAVSEAQTHLSGVRDYYTDCIHLTRNIESSDKLDFWFFRRYHGQYDGMEED